MRYYLSANPPPEGPYYGPLQPSIIGPLTPSGATAPVSYDQPSARSTPYTQQDWNKFQAAKAAGERVKNPATGQWEGGSGGGGVVSMMPSGFGGGARASFAAAGPEQGPAQADPTMVYGQQVDLGAGVMPLQEEMASRSLSRDFAMLQAQFAAQAGGGAPVSLPAAQISPSSPVPAPEAQPSLPTYAPSSGELLTDIVKEEAQVPLQSVQRVATKTGVDPKWLIGAAVLGVFLAMRK